MLAGVITEVQFLSSEFSVPISERGKIWACCRAFDSIDFGLIRRFMYQIRFTIYLLLTLSFLPGSLAAQGPGGADAGAYVILNARYGSDPRHVDVTARLKDLARRDPPFWVNYDSMNADPDDGRTKGVRIFARGPNGRERMLSCRA